MSVSGQSACNLAYCVYISINAKRIETGVSEHELQL